MTILWAARLFSYFSGMEGMLRGYNSTFFISFSEVGENRSELRILR